MLREVKFLLRSSKQNFFLSIYLSFRVFFFKKLYRNKIHKNKFQVDYQSSPSLSGQKYQTFCGT